MKTADFHYELPAELIAQHPLPKRSDSRLLVLPPGRPGPVDAAITDLARWLEPGDLLVFNDTRVLPARLHGHKATGGRVEALLERLLCDHEALVQLRCSHSPGPGTSLRLGDGSPFTVVGRSGSFFHLRLETLETLPEFLQRCGEIPLPPYMTRAPEAADAERYQTLFARQPGAVAAPTAGLHFDQALLDQLEGSGVELGWITLHVGAGTFQPVRVAEVEAHTMHSEWLRVPPRLCEQIAGTRERGGRVIAVGTTVVRALETAFRDGRVQPFSGETRLFIYPGRELRAIDGLVTNFHLPESTLLMLVCAFGGQQRVLDAYAHAVRERYRFFSYGDAMLVFPAEQGQP